MPGRNSIREIHDLPIDLRAAAAISSRTHDSKHYLRFRQLPPRIWWPQNSEFSHVLASFLSISTIRYLPSRYEA